ncbi:MAG: peptidylprolyl isomerase, partial [Gammaproteobacteria bacterium]
SYIVLTFDAYKQQVNIPEGYIDQAYADYLDNLTGQQQNRISHLMIDKSNYDNATEAKNSIEQILTDMQIGSMTFEEAVVASSDDLASKDSLGDLGLSSGDAFPEEFEVAITSMSLNDLSDVIELEDSFHVLKLTERLKPEIKNLEDMSKQLLEELVEAEALALMQEDFLELESLVLAGVTLGELADTVESSIAVTGLQDSETIALANFNNYSSTDLFNTRVLPNKIEIFEGDDSYAFVMLTQKLEPAVQPFVEVAEIAIQEVRSEKANEIIVNFAPDVEAILTGSKAMPELA